LLENEAQRSANICGTAQNVWWTSRDLISSKVLEPQYIDLQEWIQGLPKRQTTLQVRQDANGIPFQNAMTLLKGTLVVAAGTTSEGTCIVFYCASTENWSKSIKWIAMFINLAENWKHIIECCNSRFFGGYSTKFIWRLGWSTIICLSVAMTYLSEAIPLFNITSANGCLVTESYIYHATNIVLLDFIHRPVFI
jgi:hypothetical protein